MSKCEWNPVTGRDATCCVDGSDHDGCQNEAVLRVGAGPDNYHLCESCAALPVFKAYRKRVPLRRAIEKAEWKLEVES